MSTYTKLRDACKPIIHIYADDLTVHDRRWLRENPGIPFLHAARTTGTTLVPLWPADAFPGAGEYVPHVLGTGTREHIADDLVAMAEYTVRSERHLLYHYYDGRILRPVSPTAFLGLAYDYRTTLAAAFREGYVTGPRPAAYALL